MTTTSAQWNAALSAIVLLWYAAILADFTISKESPWVDAAIVLLYVAGCLCLVLARQRHVKMPRSAKWLALPILAWLALVVDGNLSTAIRLDHLVLEPSTTGLILVFANEPVRAAIVGIVVAYPTAVLFERR